MTIRNIRYLIFFLLIILLNACGSPSPKDPIYLSGTISGDEILNNPDKTIMVLVTKNTNIEHIKSNPEEAMVIYASVDTSTLDFRLDLTDRGVSPGDDIYIAAFVDINRTGSIPYPDEGDVIGFYLDKDKMSPAYQLEKGENSGIQITIDKEVYGYKTAISGRVNLVERGNLILAAYAGELISFDVADIDIDKVIGYSRMTKNQSSVSYTIDILPFGKNLPIQGVYVFAILDINENNIIDQGDKIGYYSYLQDGYPSALTINGTDLTDIDISLSIPVSEPSGYDISLSGWFDLPDGYHSNDAPIFMMVADSTSLETIWANPLSAIRYFQKLPPGENSFNMDLSKTSLAPGDEVMILAFWDRDYTDLPRLSSGDKIGFFHNTDISDLKNIRPFITLENNTTYIHPYDTYAFDLNYQVFDYETTVTFTLDPTGKPKELTEGSSLLALVVHDDGVNEEMLNYIPNDIQYVLALSSLEYVSDTNHVYTFNVFNFFDDRISDTTSMSVFIYVILDRNGDGMPSKGEDVAVYRWGILPIPWDLKTNEKNVLVNPTPTYQPHPIGWTGIKVP